jgi:SpoVK/Ycf46/Vps4 family AAA+-type ATPase
MINYKLKELKVFGSTETLFFNQKKYRRVFDEGESCYIYCEVAMVNKKFDEHVWDARVNIKCFNEQTGETLCDLNKIIPIDTAVDIMYIREGWGTPQPGWWKKGKYRWSVFIDGMHAGDTFFYIVDGGSVSPDFNPYFEIESIKMYESSRDRVRLGDRRYLSAFNANETRYVNMELAIRTLREEEDFQPIELVFNFYNHIGQHKALVHYINEVTDRPVHTLDAGYGAETKDYWVAGMYRCEIAFMDVMIAVVPFEIDYEEFEADDSMAYSVPTDGEVPFLQQPTMRGAETMTFEEATAELDKLIGLHAVKEQISEFATYLRFLKLRQGMGFEEAQKFSLHTVFTGNPGTGKTTVARLLGKIYASLGLLSNGKVHEVGRVDLVGEYIGQTAPKVKKAIENAKGGILFIDEAYALSDRGDDNKDFGREVVEVLIKEMSDGLGDIAIIFAGYPKEMHTFLNINPGLNSRISSTINFPDYSPDELMQIADFHSDKMSVSFNDEARAFAHRKIVDAYRNRGDNFGNARFVRGIISGAKQNLALRFMKLHEEDTEKTHEYTAEEVTTIVLRDVEKVFAREQNKSVSLPIDEPMLKDALAQLHELAGLPKVKKEIEETVKLVRYYREVNKDMSKAFSLHTVFSGNPGTGKTTVARVLAQIYKALGILERGHLVETDRKGLVADFVGQTASKTAAMIESAIGGCLFIDEAYALTSQGGNDFGREAIETLLKQMEDKRGKFMVIVAGYTEEMKRFLEANPGLMSRFDKTFDFEDYTDVELMAIAVQMFGKEDLVLDAAADTFLHESIKKLLNNKHKYFGNARTVRKLVEETVRRQNLRMAETAAADRSPSAIATVTEEDLRSVALLESERGTGGIGFKR